MVLCKAKTANNSKKDNFLVSTFFNANIYKNLLMNDLRQKSTD